MQENSNSLSLYLLPLATENYFNPRKQILRVSKGTGDNIQYYDCFYMPSKFNPNPKTTMAFVVTSDDFLSNNFVGLDILGFPPGEKNKEGNPSPIGLACAFLVNMNMVYPGTYGNSSNSNMNIKKAGVSDPKEVVASLTVPIPPNYTNPKEDDDENLKKKNSGVFINENGVIVILSANGASITIGEGIHFAGQISSDKSSPKEGFMLTNPFHTLLASTIPTALVAGFRSFINPGAFMAFAEASMKLGDTILKATKAGQLLAKSSSIISSISGR